MKTVSVIADYEYYRPRRYVFRFKAGVIYQGIEDPIAAAIERDGAGRIVGTTGQSVSSDAG